MTSPFAPLARIALLSCCAAVAAAETSVTLASVDASGVGKTLGTVRISESAHGLLFTPALAELAPGVHGFHVHDDVRNRALMNHVGGDNHADHPAPLGGGGARLACGVIGAR
ncbi:MAG: hypothetical protein ABL900_12950 [Burkholderiaceae bacterium]